MKKHHRNIGEVEFVRAVPAEKGEPINAEVRLPSGELRTVDITWLTDPPTPTTPTDAPVQTPDAKPQ